jgi:signal transduction histidine kinase
LLGAWSGFDFKKSRLPAIGANPGADWRQVESLLPAAYPAAASVAEHRAAQLLAMTSALARAEERERRRLAQILHDHLQPLLIAAKLKTGAR